MEQNQAAILVSKALMDEVCATPKPGLADRTNSGSHQDMDIFTFTASITALFPYWERYVQIGRETAARAPEDTFRVLKQAGQSAERVMLAATGGVNTHKGAVFTLGTICGGGMPDAAGADTSSKHGRATTVGPGVYPTESLSRRLCRPAGRRIFSV